MDCGSKVHADLVDCRKKFSRFDDVWDGLLFRLARDPEAGTEEPFHPKVFLMETPVTGDADLPRIAVLYQFNATKVFLIRVAAKP